MSLQKNKKIFELLDKKLQLGSWGKRGIYFYCPAGALKGRIPCGNCHNANANKECSVKVEVAETRKELIGFLKSNPNILLCCDWYEDKEK